jgi:SagB-type dehydrogenase family enzyme
MPDQDIGRQFMRASQVAQLAPSEQSRGLPQPPLELPFSEPGPRVDLPDPHTLALGRVDLIEVINARRSRRHYSEAPVSLDELSFLLWCTQGVKECTDRPATLRPVPSAGSRHAFETLLLANRVDGLSPGLYRFLAIEHRLARLDSPPDFAERLTTACRQQNMVRTSAVTFIWVAVLARMRWRYGLRGYRYLHMDAGHICQNLYLAGKSIGCDVCAIGGFDDDAVNRELGLDGEELFAIYLATLGKEKQTTDKNG